MPHNKVKRELQNIDRFWFVAIQALDKFCDRVPLLPGDGLKFRVDCSKVAEV